MLQAMSVSESAKFIQCSCWGKVASVPRNARSKRAFEAWAPKEYEDKRTAIFARGSHKIEVPNSVVKDLVHYSPFGMASIALIQINAEVRWNLGRQSPRSTFQNSN